MDFHTLIDTLRQRLDLPTLSADEQGGYQLEFDGMPVYCFRISGFVYLESPLQTPPTNAREAVDLFRDILQRNLARLNQQAAVLSLDEDTNTVMLHQSLPLDSLDIHRFEDALEEFLNHLEYWRGEASSTPASMMPGAMQMFFP